MIQYYFNQNSALSYVNVNGTFMKRNAVQFECPWNDVYNLSCNLTIYIGLTGKGGRPLKELH